MANHGFFRCAARDCDVWFPTSEHQSLCSLHRNGTEPLTLSTTPAEVSEEKQSYLETVNAERKACYEMTMEELEVHILSLQKTMEDQKVLLLTARSIRSEKIQGMNDEEIKKLSKVRVSKAVSNDPATSKQKTMAKDPIGYLMEKHGFTREVAKSMLGLS